MFLVEGSAAAADFGSSGASVVGSFILSLESWLRHSNTAILLLAAPTTVARSTGMVRTARRKKEQDEARCSVDALDVLACIVIEEGDEG